jgi:hypothetical protein
MTTIYLDKARPRADGLRWALYIREWDGIDKPEHTEIARLTDEKAKLLEAAKVPWRSPPEWHIVELEDERAVCRKRIAEIDAKLARAGRP